MEAFMRRIVGFIDSMIEMDQFSLFNGLIRSVRTRVKFDISKSIIPIAWIPYQFVYVWVEFMYKRLSKFYYYCTKLTHQSKFCEAADDSSIALEVRMHSMGNG